MNIVTRILIAAVVFSVATVVAWLVNVSLGVERGTWQYAISIGVTIAIVSYVWRKTATKDLPRHNQTETLPLIHKRP
jgi:hypothetical protein